MRGIDDLFEQLKSKQTEISARDGQGPGSGRVEMIDGTKD